MANMGLDFGLQPGESRFKKRNFRWLFYIPEVCGDTSAGINSLPPQKSARPNIQYKEMEARHLIEDVYYPAKPDWKPVNITLYDLSFQKHPVFEWLKILYDPEVGEFHEPLYQVGQYPFIREAYLSMYDGCGNLIESWIYEDAWPQSVNFQGLDMSDINVTVCELTLRYARAYIDKRANTQIC